MVPVSPAAQILARRLLAPARGPSRGLVESADGAHSTPDHVAAAERVGHELANALSRSLGPQAYHALLTRALSQTKGSQPPLSLLTVGTPLEPYLEGLDAAAASHGPDALIDALVSLFAVLTDLLGRVIGEDMAMALVARAAGPPSDSARATGTDLPGDPGTAA